MNDVSGESFLLARTSLHKTENFSLLSQTVQDFAVYIHPPGALWGLTKKALH